MNKGIIKTESNKPFICEPYFTTLDNEIFELNFCIDNSDINRIFFYELYQKGYLSSKINSFNFLFIMDNKEYLFYSCFVKSISEYFDTISISLSFSAFEIMEEKSIEEINLTFQNYRSPVKQEIYNKINSNENDLFNRKEIIENAIISADENEIILKEILQELNLFLNDYDLFFDKKLLGEIKYL
jgi:hypothetical protein